jgi:hypothetical protein
MVPLASLMSGAEGDFSEIKDGTADYEDTDVLHAFLLKPSSKKQNHK